MKRLVRIVAIAGSVALAGCATMVNPYKIHTVTPANGRRTTVTRLELNHTGSQLAVYDGAERLDIHDAADEHFHSVVCYRFDPDHPPPRGMIWVDSNCMHAILEPYIELDKSMPHTLRLVRPSGEASVTVAAGTHWQWFWFNGIWGPAAPIGWAVDLAKGSWRYYTSLDVDHAFRSAATATRASR